MSSSLFPSSTAELLVEEEFQTAADAQGDYEDFKKRPSLHLFILQLLKSMPPVPLFKPLSVELFDLETHLKNLREELCNAEKVLAAEELLNAEKVRAAEELRNAEEFLLCNDPKKERALLAKWAKPTRGGAYRSTEGPHVTTMQWPKVTVTHMMSSLGTMENLISYYRDLKLADHLNDEDLRCFLEEQLCKEKAGLSEMSITSRLDTRKHVLSAMGEIHDSCSICMVDYKEQDKIASLCYCTHEYHEHCIKEWLLKSNLCPMCRALAIIPEDYPSWDGDVKLHQAFFVQGKCTT